MRVFIFKYKTKDQKQMSVLFAFYQKVNRDTGYKYSIRFDNEYGIVHRKDDINFCLPFEPKEKSFGLRKYFTEYWLLIQQDNVVT